MSFINQVLTFNNLTWDIQNTRTPYARTKRRLVRLWQLAGQTSRRYLQNLVWTPYLQQLSATGVVILWSTRIGNHPAVRYGKDQNYGQAAYGTTRLIKALNMQLQRVALTNLEPDTVYHYKIYSNGADLLPQKTFSFCTAPQTGADTPFRFVVFGDFGRKSNVQKHLCKQLIRDNSFRFILTTGDNSQIKGSYTDFHDRVFDIYRDLFPKVGLYTALGNHDYITGDGAPYLDLFDLPDNAWRQEDKKRYYSFDYGSVHFSIVDSNLIAKKDKIASANDMVCWLMDDLAKTEQPWKIIICHHPFYNAGRHGPSRNVREKLRPIFEAHGVDLVFSGHEHNYQRSKPLKQDQVAPVNEGGIYYIISGAGGAADARCLDPHAEWLDRTIYSASYGLYHRLTVKGTTLQLETIDGFGTIRDTFFLRKP